MTSSQALLVAAHDFLELWSFFKVPNGELAINVSCNKCTQ